MLTLSNVLYQKRAKRTDSKARRLIYFFYVVTRIFIQLKYSIPGSILNEFLQKFTVRVTAVQKVPFAFPQILALKAEISVVAHTTTHTVGFELSFEHWRRALRTVSAAGF